MSDKDTPMFCTRCHKTVQDQGECPKGGNHHLISISDKGVQGQGDEPGAESMKNSRPKDPHDVKPSANWPGFKTSVAHPNDRIRAYAMQYLAHDSGDGQTVYHCPFCGGGNVIGRSDGTIECGFCNTHFTVQVQPEFAGMPQTIDGQPYDVPGMPGGVDPMTGQPPMMDDGSEMGDEMPPEGPPDGADMGSPEDEEAQGKNGTSVPWEHQSSRRIAAKSPEWTQGFDHGVTGHPEEYQDEWAPEQVDDYSDGHEEGRRVRRRSDDDRRFLSARKTWTAHCLDCDWTKPNNKRQDDAMGEANKHSREMGQGHRGAIRTDKPVEARRYASLIGEMTEDQYMAHLALVHSVQLDR
jgi:hypothetical protein